MGKSFENRQEGLEKIAEKAMIDISRKCNSGDDERDFEDICNVVGMLCAEMFFAIDNEEVVHYVQSALMAHISNGMMQYGVNVPPDSEALH